MTPKPESARIMQVVAPAVAVCAGIQGDAPYETMLLQGELFVVEKEGDAYSVYGHPANDPEIKGYIRPSGHLLRSNPVKTDYRVRAATTVVYRRPSEKSRPSATLSMNALVSRKGEKDGFILIGDSQWVFERHLTPLEAYNGDWVGTIVLLQGAPYVWGGCSAVHGFDCSGLIKAGLVAIGIHAPHNAAKMATVLGHELPYRRFPIGLMRGDLIFWPEDDGHISHVGVMLDSEMLLHASGAPYCSVLSEALVNVYRRKGPPACIRRL